MLAVQLGACTTLQALKSQSAANTAAATSAYIDVRGFEGEIVVDINIGTITGTVDFTFSTNDVANGTGATLIVPLDGALAQITTSNDDAVYTARFDTAKLRGYLSIIGTIGTGPALLGYTIKGRKKYAS